MRKNIWNKLIGLALFTVSFVACETADQDTAPVISPDNKPTATFTPLTSYSTVTEGDTVIYNVSIDKTIDRSLTATARLVEGTADEDDFVVLSGIIKPYSTSASVMIIFNQDWDVEDSETVKFEFGVFSIADKYMLHTNTVNPSLSLTVDNYVSDVLGVLVGWSQEVTMLDTIWRDVDMGGWTMTIFDTVEVVTDAGDEIDWDIFVSEADGFDISDPWSSNITDVAATGDNPEELEIVGYPDGEYIIWANLWANGLVHYFQFEDSTLVCPITATFSKQGTDLDLTTEQASSQLAPINMPGWDDNETEFDVIVARFVVTNGKFTIIDGDATEYGPYKAGLMRTPRPSKYMK